MFDDIFSPNDIHLLASSLIVHLRCCEHALYTMDNFNVDDSTYPDVEATLIECEKLFNKIKQYSDSHGIDLIFDRCEPTAPDGFPN